MTKQTIIITLAAVSIVAISASTAAFVYLQQNNNDSSSEVQTNVTNESGSTEVEILDTTANETLMMNSTTITNPDFPNWSIDIMDGWTHTLEENDMYTKYDVRKTGTKDIESGLEYGYSFLLAYSGLGGGGIPCYQKNQIIQINDAIFTTNPNNLRAQTDTPSEPLNPAIAFDRYVLNSDMRITDPTMKSNEISRYQVEFGEVVDECFMTIHFGQTPTALSEGPAAIIISDYTVIGSPEEAEMAAMVQTMKF